MRKILRFSAVALVPFVILACEPPDPDEPVLEEEPDTPVVDEPVEEREFEVGDEETVSLDEVDDSGVTGEAHFTVEGDMQTRVMVEVDGAPPNANLTAHLLFGECDPMGEPIQELEQITTDAEGEGTSTSMLEMGLAGIMDGSHSVAVHSEDDVPLACGEIPAHDEILGW